MRTEPVGTAPEEFAGTIIEVHGEAGRTWLRGLPALLAHAAEKWSLTLGEKPFAPLSYNYVIPAVRRADGTPVVVKAGVPGKEVDTEINALRFLSGTGIAALLDADDDRGLLLLERLTPGGSLIGLVEQDRDDEATLYAASVMAQLWRPIPPDHGFPTVAEWAEALDRLRQRFQGGTGPLSVALVEKAEALFADLLHVSAGPAVLLHGDLHHGNILASDHPQFCWRAIDPKGVVGEPAYEVGALLRNPMPQLLDFSNPERVLGRRIALLSERLDLDRTRLRDCGLAQCVLSACWSVEDHGDGWQEAMVIAEHLAALR